MHTQRIRDSLWRDVFRRILKNKVAVAGGASADTVGLDVVGVVGVGDGCGELVAVGAGVLVAGTGDDAGRSSGDGVGGVGSGVGETLVLGVSISRSVRPTVHAVSDRLTSKQRVVVLYIIVCLLSKWLLPPR